jgi:hypothetical protein
LYDNKAVLHLVDLLARDAVASGSRQQLLRPRLAMLQVLPI